MFKQKKNILLFVSFLTILLKNGFSQSNLPNVDIFRPPIDNPKTQNATAIFNFSPYEVDKSSGTVNINIPFYTIRAGKINVPVNLFYKTTGIKVQDIASGVGLGWSLNAGYCITVNEENTYLPYNLRLLKNQSAVEVAPLSNFVHEIYNAFNGYYPTIRTIYNFNCGEFDLL
ncbi:hypothetical protein [Sphingobacterium anhuiense]|uniref:hypothetical protein n=1 Tax=Sphingobacterium anhuiense TaxID=493780 RepID=UPI003C2FFB08